MAKAKKKASKKSACAVKMGRKGGLKAKRLKLGIHSPEYKRKTKRKRK